MNEARSSLVGAPGLGGSAAAKGADVAPRRHFETEALNVGAGGSLEWVTAVGWQMTAIRVEVLPDALGLSPAGALGVWREPGAWVDFVRFAAHGIAISAARWLVNCAAADGRRASSGR
jgi:hypothetical protein